MLQANPRAMSIKAHWGLASGTIAHREIKLVHMGYSRASMVRMSSLAFCECHSRHHQCPVPALLADTFFPDDSFIH